MGGTIDTESMTISVPISESGSYSVFGGGSDAGDGTGLSGLSITPRVFSPSGGFANTVASIGFMLGRPGPVTVKIFNRAGRLVSEVVSGERLNAGANLVHWDGRGRGGSLVGDGIYLVTVEAHGEKQVKPLAVVK